MKARPSIFDDQLFLDFSTSDRSSLSTETMTEIFTRFLNGSRKFFVEEIKIYNEEFDPGSG